MIKRIKKWWKEDREITRKTGGLAEKQESMKRKLDVAMSILTEERRERNIPVEVDRRRLKLA